MLIVRGFLVLFFIILSTTCYAQEFTLTSTTIEPDSTLTEEQVYKGFGCSGNNKSPALEWKGAPEGTKSFAVTVYDPDAPTGSGWWHWIVYNIPSHVAGVIAGVGEASGELLPYGATQGRNDYGAYAFGGACPPQGDEPHHYVFTVHALKIDKIDLPQDASAAMIGFMINANSIGKANLTATFSR